MNHRLSISELNRRKKAGTIQGYQETKIHKPGPKSKPKTLQNLEWDLIIWCERNNLKLETEYRFDDTRKFRFDYAIPEKMIAIEYNGVMSEKSRHTTIKGYSTDMEKLNLAQAKGWRVLNYTPLNCKNVLNDLNKIINQ